MKQSFGSTQSNKSFRGPGKPLHAFLIILIVLCVAAVSLYCWQVKSNQGKLAKSQPAEKVSWKSTDLVGIYAFDYPSGWHVVWLWAYETEQGDSIWISPDPISTAPRGGPVGAVIISDKSGFSNPEEIFEQDREEYKNSLQELQEETIDAEFGTIYHYSGKSEIYGETVSVEKYFFLIQGLDSGDNINKHIIAVTEDFVVAGDTEKSEILKQVVMSFKLDN